MGGKLDLILHIQIKYHNGIPSFVVLDDIIRSVYLFTTFKPFSPFYESFNEKIELLSSNGDIAYATSMSQMPLKWKIPESGPMVLTFYDLRLGFLAWGIMLVVSCCTFLLELFVRFCRDRAGDRVN